MDFLRGEIALLKASVESHLTSYISVQFPNIISVDRKITMG